MHQHAEARAQAYGAVWRQICEEYPAKRTLGCSKEVIEAHRDYWYGVLVRMQVPMVFWRNGDAHVWADCQLPPAAVDTLLAQFAMLE